MEWLLGTLVGAGIGLVSALVATEYTAWRERKRRKTDSAESLLSEISVNRVAVMAGINTVKQGKRPLKAPFERSLLAGRAGDIGLLPNKTRVLVISFYGCLNDLGSVVEEWYFQEARRPLGAAEPGYLETWGYLQEQFLEVAQLTVQNADAALAELGKLVGQRP